MKDFADTRMREWHFVVLILLLTVLIHTFGVPNLKNTPILDMDNCLIELNDGDFLDSISSCLCFVLFFTEDSDLCNEMSYNLNCIAKNKKMDAGFFKLNLEKYPVYSKKYTISGVPSIFIFSNGKEIKRIMGIVPEHNLEKIYHKYHKKREA